jgi:glutathione S-transferase
MAERDGELMFYTNPQSRGRIVRWLLEEAGVDYRTEVPEYDTSMKAAAYLAINPMGKVPAIVHGGRVVTEAAAICAYIADAFPDSGLAPPLAARHDYYRWLFYFAGVVEAAVTNRALGMLVPAGKDRMIGYGSYEIVMDVVELAVSRADYIAGDAFTAADVYCGSHIGWGLQFGSMDRRPAFAAYWARLCARPAWQRATELDDALVPASA